MIAGVRLGKCYTATGSCKIESNKVTGGKPEINTWIKPKLNEFDLFSKNSVQVIFPSVTIHSVASGFLELSS